MCGIAGYLGKRPLSPETIERTLLLMRNRGPDYRAHEQIERNGLVLHLLHSRLSIIDLDPRSHQPMARGEITVIFNGEIYNYVELRYDLEKQGRTFTTESDTEVLLQSYLMYGEKCVERFEGMWSFALYDPRRDILFLSRDRFAEKPFFYLRVADGFYFGSEPHFLSALSGRPLKADTEQVLRYLVYGYKSLYKSENTFLEGVREIPPAANTIIDLKHPDREPSVRRYWTPGFKPQAMSEKDALSGIREHLARSLEIRLRADVPLAFCLSGGIDSGTLVSLARKQFECDVHAYSIIDTDERYNELENIEATVRDTGCRHSIVRLTPEHSFDRLREMIRYRSAPVATITYYVHSFLSEQIAKDGYKIVLSGTAADELFTGYYDHFLFHLAELSDHPDIALRRTEWKENILPFVRNSLLRDPDRFTHNPDSRDHLYTEQDDFTRFLARPFRYTHCEERFTAAPLRNRMLNEVFHEITRVILHEDDANSMMFSLENRSPFLDRQLFEFAFSIPTELLIKNGYGKYLLRSAMAGILNDAVRLDRLKKGFNASIDSVFSLRKGLLREFLLEDGPLYELIRRETVSEVLKRSPLPNHFSKFLFNIINTKLFLELHG